MFPPSALTVKEENNLKPFLFSQITLYTFVNLLISTNGIRVLGVFPWPCKSHLYYSTAIMQSLYNAGHEITFISPFPEHELLKNFTAVNSLPISMKFDQVINFEDATNENYHQDISIMADLERKFCTYILSSPHVQSTMTAEEKLYDVIFLEFFYHYECLSYLAKRANLSIIILSSLKTWKLHNIAIGKPNNPSVIPYSYTEFSDKMTFTQRLKNTFASFHLDLHKYTIGSWEPAEIYGKLYKQTFIPEKKISFLFSNNHPTLLPLYSTPTDINIGGIHIQPAKALPANLQKILDESEHGIILFSLGSLVKTSSMNHKLKTTFLEAFATIPQQVIWKFEEPIENVSSNVILMKWLPQRDLLAHKNVIAFMSHCGISGLQESISEAVPMVFVPLAYDQRSNAAILHQHGVGVSLDIHTITKDDIIDALNAVINDTKYRNAMKILSRRFADTLMSPQESVVYWTEYIVRHKGALYLRSAAADVPFFQYLYLDAMVFIFFILFASIYLIAFVCGKISR